MSGHLGPQASTKGETTSKPTSKTGYDRLDINKLYKGKTAEPVAKAVAQKHGMQSLGKTLPARRAGASIVKPETTPPNDSINNTSVPLTQQPPVTDLGQPTSQHPKWTNSTHPQGPPPMSVPNVQPSGPPIHEKNWNGPDVAGNYQSQRFAQEFPSLDAGSDPPRGSMTNTQPPVSGVQNSSKSQDNQYGPGPILRPQTEGSWIQGGGRGGQRPPGNQGLASRDQGQDRLNLGGPTPPPMSLGQGGQAPPPLGAYPMQFRGMAPFMYPNGPPPGPGFYPSGQGMPRYGMPVPPGAPPPREREHSDSHRESNRGRGGPPPMRPTQQFAVKPILRQEDLKRMDDIDQEGSWASVKEEVDYNKKINFSDEDDDKREASRRSVEIKDEEGRSNREKKPIRILERQQSGNERQQQHRERERYDSSSKDSGNVEQDREEDWNKPRSQQFETKDRSGARRGRDSREEDWRGSRYEEESRNKKASLPSRIDPRSGGTDFNSKQYSNLPPRLMKQQQYQNSQPYTNQRKTPSPGAPTNNSGNDRDFQRERDWENDKRNTTTQYRILERNRGDSESSSNSIRDKRGSNDYNSRSIEKEGSRQESTTESLKEKMEVLDLKRDEKSGGLGKTSFSTSSWADQVDDEDYSKDYEDYQKSTVLKPEAKEERTVPKRVYIQQRKVENMTLAKGEVKSEPNPAAELAKQQDKSSDKNKSSSIWGDREERDQSTKPEIKQGSVVDDKMSEIILSDKARLLNQNRDEKEKSDRRHENDTYSDTRERERFGSNQEAESRQERDRAWSREPRERPRPTRWGGSTEYRNDNRTPERDANTSGRSSATDNSNASYANVAESEKSHTIQKSRSAEIIKENSPQEKDDGKGYRDEHSNKHRDNSHKNVPEEDIDMRSNPKGGGRKEQRTGHAVYQPRGGWGGRQDVRGKSARGGGGREYYDRPRRNEFDREQHDDRIPKEHDSEYNEKLDQETSASHEDIRNEVSNEDERNKKDGAGDSMRKGIKSPVGNKRNVRGGGRLHGYGPPSDKPFSSGSTSKDEELGKDKPSEASSKSSTGGGVGGGPVPLMELGDISPPNMVGGRARHHGGAGNRGARGGAVQPKQERQEGYSFRGGSKRGRGGDAKPLMSINSNELEKHEGDTGSESQDDETKKASKKKESGGKGVHEKYRQNQNELKNTSSKDKSNPETSNIDSANNNKSKTNKPGNNTADVYQSGNGHEAGGPEIASDNSENVDNDGKKDASKDKLNYTNKNSRNEKQSQGASKDRRVKHPPYDPPHPRSAVPPRFQKNSNQSQFPNSKNTDATPPAKDNTEFSTNTWEKTPGPQKSEFSSQHSHQQQSQSDQKGLLTQDIKPPTTSSTQVMNTSSGAMDGSGGPLKTMIFENRNFKNVSKPAGSGKGNDSIDTSITNSGLELTKDIGLSFGKDPSSDGQDMSYGSNFEDQSSQQASQISNYPTTKPTPIGQSRAFQHQPSPVSPLAKDLTEKIQSVRQVWEKAVMPSVAEQSVVSSADDSNFHSSFAVGGDTFKTDSSRDFSGTIQHSQSGYASGSSPAIAAISKPDSSTSPNSVNMRQIKPPQQQTSLENHVGMSSSPFAFSMPQQHQVSAFGAAVPSPPTAMVYGSSQPLSGHTGVYQAFPHVDSSQVMNASARNQYNQYSNPQGNAGTPYGLNSIFMTSMDPGYQQMSSYQLSHHQQQHSQSGQGPTPSNRSPGPMPTSGGGSTAGVMTAMKAQQTPVGHPSMAHQVMGTPNQQAYSQMTHHHTNMGHHQLPPVGHPNKPAGPGYTQSALPSQSQQIYIPYDPQQVLNYGQNFVSSGLRNAPGGPPPSATPPVQGMQGSSSYYSGNASNQVYQGSNQASGLQQLHVAVAPNPQALQNLQTATQQYGQQFQMPSNYLQGYSQQAASTVSALNLSGQHIRPGGHSAHSHYNMKPGLDMVQQSHALKSHEQMMNQTWNTQGFSLNQGFHGGSKTGGNQDRNPGAIIGNQRKGNHQMGNMPNMGSVKYMPNTGYPSAQSYTSSRRDDMQQHLDQSDHQGQ